MSTKYIFLDIDGTVVDFDGNLPESAREALLRAQSEGHRLIAATGRFRAQIYPWLLELIKFDGYITSSGAHVRFGGETVRTSYMTRESVRWLSELFGGMGAPVIYHTDENLVTTEREYNALIDFFVRSGLEPDECSTLFKQMIFADARELDCIEKAVYFDSGRGLAEMRALLGGYQLDPYSFKQLPPTCGEVTSAGVTKASAIEAIMRRFGIGPEDVAAIGDGGNDLEMIRFAGLGIAMGNASEQLKAEADFVTDDIGRDGLAKAIEYITGR